MEIDKIIIAMLQDGPTAALLAHLPEEVQENVKLGWSRILSDNLDPAAVTALADIQKKLLESETASLAKDTLIEALEARLKQVAADLAAAKPAVAADEPGFDVAPAPAIKPAPESPAPATPAQE